MRSVNNSAELMLLFKRPFFGGFTFSVAYGSFYFPGEFNGTFGNRTQSNLIERLSSIDEQNRTHKKFGQSNAIERSISKLLIGQLINCLDRLRKKNSLC